MCGVRGPARPSPRAFYAVCGVRGPAPPCPRPFYAVCGVRGPGSALSPVFFHGVRRASPGSALPPAESHARRRSHLSGGGVAARRRVAPVDAAPEADDLGELLAEDAAAQRVEREVDGEAADVERARVVLPDEHEAARRRDQSVALQLPHDELDENGHEGDHVGGGDEDQHDGDLHALVCAVRCRLALQMLLVVVQLEAVAGALAAPLAQAGDARDDTSVEEGDEEDGHDAEDERLD